VRPGAPVDSVHALAAWRRSCSRSRVVCAITSKTKFGFMMGQNQWRSTHRTLAVWHFRWRELYLTQQ
jgi:hypothetical protein